MESYRDKKILNIANSFKWSKSKDNHGLFLKLSMIWI